MTSETWRVVLAPRYPDGAAEERQLTALECAVLQGFSPSLTLSGGSSAARVKIGDAVPPPAAQRIAEQMLHTLLLADAGGFVLSSGGGVWVREHQIAGHA